MYVFMYYLMYSCSMLCTLGITMAYWKSHFKVAARFSTCRQGKKAILKRRAETIHSTKRRILIHYNDVQEYAQRDI